MINYLDVMQSCNQEWHHFIGTGRIAPLVLTLQSQAVASIEILLQDLIINVKQIMQGFAIIVAIQVQFLQ